MKTLLYLGTYIEAQQIAIATVPLLPQEIVATGYKNLQIISTIAGSPLFCARRIKGQVANFYENQACLTEGLISDDQYSEVCLETGNVVTFIFTIKIPIYNEVNFYVDCSFPASVTDSITIQVKGKRLHIATNLNYS